MSWARIYAVVCPKCGAKQGQKCVTASGEETINVHIYRIRRANSNPKSTEIHYVYPKKPKLIGVVAVTPDDVRVLATRVQTR